MIYFITAREIGRVKIGYSAEPRSRFVKMRTDSPVPLALERICEGEVCDERAVHERFAADRLAGEWFTLSPDIESHMAELAAPRGRPPSLNALLTSLGMSKGYASQLLKCPDAIPIPVLVALYRSHGLRLGIVAEATDDEIDTLEKFCGCWKPLAERAA